MSAVFIYFYTVLKEMNVWSKCEASLLGLLCCLLKTQSGEQQKTSSREGRRIQHLDPSTRHKKTKQNKEQLIRLSLESQVVFFFTNSHIQHAPHPLLFYFSITSTTNIAILFPKRKKHFFQSVCKIKITWCDEKTTACETTLQPTNGPADQSSTLDASK